MNGSQAMKSCVIILLVALLCAERAQGLDCYNCMEVPLDASCKSLSCPYDNGLCISQVVEISMDSEKRKLKNKFCFPICPHDPENTKYMGPGVILKTSCCMEDLCNAAVPTRDSTWIMAGLLLLSLGSVLLQTLM